MIAHDAAVAAIYSDAKRGAIGTLRTMLDGRAISDSSLKAALALSLFSLDARTYRQTFVSNYPSDDVGVNADYGGSLLAARLYRDGALHPINLIAKLALHDPDARTRLLAALVGSRETQQRNYALAAGHILRTLPAGDALATLAKLTPPIRIVAVSEIDWCGRRPNDSIARAERGGAPTAADAATVSVERGIAQAASHCRRNVPSARHTKR